MFQRNKITNQLETILNIYRHRKKKYSDSCDTDSCDIGSTMSSSSMENVSNIKNENNNSNE